MRFDRMFAAGLTAGLILTLAPNPPANAEFDVGPD